jgi:long-subunit acyl-CoA synthetase (AMP-forming)
VKYEDIVIDKEDIYTFSYTIGTTGPPKGAMFSHRNITAILASL